MAQYGKSEYWEAGETERRVVEVELDQRPERWTLLKYVVQICLDENRKTHPCFNLSYTIIHHNTQYISIISFDCVAHWLMFWFKTATPGALHQGSRTFRLVSALGWAQGEGFSIRFFWAEVAIKCRARLNEKIDLLGLKFWELQNDCLFDILVIRDFVSLSEHFRVFERPSFSRLSDCRTCGLSSDVIFQETFTEFAQPSHAILMLGCGNSRLSEETPMMFVNLKSHNDDRIIDNHWDPQYLLVFEDKKKLHT